MIVGIGIDIIEVERIKKLVEKNPRFVQRIFTPQEIRYCQKKANRYQHYAARFAAKEAFFKALGRRIKWKDVGLTNLSSGQPKLKIMAEEKFPFDRAHVSISHLSAYAAAIVILESEE
ncbi:MAG: holo-ACP synthase [Candidatus Aminicenantales bacterium]